MRYTVETLDKLARKRGGYTSFGRLGTTACIHRPYRLYTIFSSTHLVFAGYDNTGNFLFKVRHFGPTE